MKRALKIAKNTGIQDDEGKLYWLQKVLKFVGRGVSVFLALGAIDQILRFYLKKIDVPFPLFLSVAFNVWLLWELILD